MRRIDVYAGYPEEPSAISFRSLIRLLSSPEYIVSSVHVRNTLLAGLTNRQDAGLPSGSTSDQGGWQALREYQPGAQVTVFGDVPGQLLSHPEPHISEPALSHESIWGIAFLRSSVFREPSNPQAYLDRPDVGLWLSCESDLMQQQMDLVRSKPSGEADPSISLPPAALVLLRYTLWEWFPAARSSFRQAVRAHFASRDVHLSDDEKALPGHAPPGKDYTSHLIFKWDQNVFKAALDIIEQNAKEEPIPGRRRLACSLLGTYANMQVDEWEPRARLDSLEKLISSGGRWKVETLDPDSAEMVTSMNKLKFPAAHLLRKPFLTVCVRDNPVSTNSPPFERSHAYASEQSPGSAAGWVYTHEDLSLASLHVAPAYRQMKAATPVSESDPTRIVTLSIGRLVTDLISLKIAIHVRKALISCAALDESISRETYPSSDLCPWPVIADTEADDTNAGVRRFYEKVGFRDVGRRTWGVLNLFNE